MGNKKFGIFSLLVILLTFTGECKAGFGSFAGSLMGSLAGRAIHKLTKPKPKPQTTYLYSSLPTYGGPPMYNQPPQFGPGAPITPNNQPPQFGPGAHITPNNQPPQFGPGAPITPVQFPNTNTAPGYNPGGGLQTKPAYPGQMPVGVVHNSSPISAFTFHPSFYGFIGIVTYLLGKGYRLIV